MWQGRKRESPWCTGVYKNIESIGARKCFAKSGGRVGLEYRNEVLQSEEENAGGDSSIDVSVYAVDV